MIPPMPKRARPRAKDIKSDVGRRLKWAREIVCTSSAGCARALGVPHSTWQHWEDGDRYPDPFHMVRFCDIFGITADWIYRGRFRGIAPEIQLRLAAEHPEALEADPDMAVPAMVAVPVS